MRQLYERVLSMLRDISFDSIWSGFNLMDFALYNNTTVYLADGEIPYDNRFLGNSSIVYNGGQLAIWEISNEEEVIIEELVASIVHEMFHSYQSEQGECRYPNDLIGLDYPLELDNYCYKYEENKLIVRAINSNDYREKMELLHKFITYREYRINKFGEIIKYEWYTETLEGVAEYVGTKALEQISYDLYKKRITEYKKIINNLDMVFDVRRCSYYTGTLFLLLLDDMNIPIPSRIKDEKITIFEQIVKHFHEDYLILPHLNKYSNDLLGAEIEPALTRVEYITIIEEKFTEYNTNKNKLFQDFFDNNIKKEEGNFSICGYDPMNMVKIDGKIFCSHFINLMNKDTREAIFIQGPIVLISEINSYHDVSGYFILEE